MGCVLAMYVYRLLSREIVRAIQGSSFHTHNISVFCRAESSAGRTTLKLVNDSVRYEGVLIRGLSFGVIDGSYCRFFSFSECRTVGCGCFAAETWKCCTWYIACNRRKKLENDGRGSHRMCQTSLEPLYSLV